MILLNLSLQNFKRYKEFDLEFKEGLTGIIGKNGSGKSSIFESILFALYGELRTKGYKEIIRNDKAAATDPVVVELDFEFDSSLYSIKREFRGKTLSANGKILKNGELIVSGAKEVTAYMISLTKMSKVAFLHTLFASQKELTSLSTMRNEDRKKMIRKLLGLEKIDFIEKELIESTRELNRELETFKEVLLSDEEKNEKSLQIKKYEKDKGEISKDVEVGSKELDSLKLKGVDIKKELDLFEKTKEKKQKLYSSMELIKNSIDSNEALKKKQLKELGELEKKKEEFDKESFLIKKFLKIEADLKEQEKLKEHALKKEGLLKEQQQLRVQYTKTKDDIKVLEKECLMYDKHIFDLKNLDQNLSHLGDNIVEKQTIEKEILSEIAGEQKIIDATNEKIEYLKRLGKESNCPTCTRPLLEEYESVVSSLNEVVEGIHKKKIAEHQIQLNNVIGQKNSFEKELKKKQKQHSELVKIITVIESKQKDLKSAKEYFNQIESKGIQNKNELELLEHYSYDQKFHKSMESEHKEIKPKYQNLLNLQTSLKRIADIQKELLDIDKKLEELDKNYNDVEIEFKGVVYDEKSHLDKKQESDINQKHKDEKTNLLHELKLKVSNIEGQIKVIQKTLDDNQKHLDKLQVKKDDLKDYEKIKISLGEFKTKLNSKVAPRISDIASNMYSTITKGKYQHIEVNTDFDFFIYDDGVKYPIERFSGGEVDLANLVLRIAISKTLSELNGTNSIGFLAFDEVFGSQDESRRMMILEAFHTIKEQYRQIFLISHEIEIKEMFERVVEL